MRTWLKTATITSFCTRVLRYLMGAQLHLQGQANAEGSGGTGRRGAKSYAYSLHRANTLPCVSSTLPPVNGSGDVLRLSGGHPTRPALSRRTWTKRQVKNCLETGLSQQSAGQQGVHVQHARAAFAHQVDPSHLAFAMRNGRLAISVEDAF